MLSTIFVKSDSLWMSHKLMIHIRLLLVIKINITSDVCVSVCVFAEPCAT